MSGHEAARQQNQNRTPFSAIAMGAFRCDRPQTPPPLPRSCDGPHTPSHPTTSGYSNARVMAGARTTTQAPARPMRARRGAQGRRGTRPGTPGRARRGRRVRHRPTDLRGTAVHVLPHAPPRSSPPCRWADPLCTAPHSLQGGGEFRPGKISPPLKSPKPQASMCLAKCLSIFEK